MKRILVLIIFSLGLLGVYSQEIKTKADLINFLEGDWLFKYAKGGWGETFAEKQGFSTRINFTRILTTKDSMHFNIYVADTLFYSRTQNIDSVAWGKESAWILNKPNDKEKIDIISENKITLMRYNFANAGISEYNRIPVEIVNSNYKFLESNFAWLNKR